MTVTSRDVQDKVQSTGNDLLGRWARVVATFDDVKLAIYTIYIPQAGGLGGASTIRRQLHHSMGRRLESEGENRTGEEETGSKED